MRRSVVALACVGLVVLAGCNGDESPPGPPTFDADGQTEASAPVTSDVEPTTATAAPPTDTETATATEEPTSEEPTETDEPGDPEDFEDTEAGAEAFVRYFVDLWSSAAQDPESADLERFYGEGCVRCTDIEDYLADLISRGEHADAPLGSITLIQPLNVGHGYVVDTQMIDGPYSYVDKNGEVTRGPFEAVPVNLVFELTHEQGRGFVVDEIVHVGS